MFNIECYDVNKEDYGLEQYTSIKEIKFWHFNESPGKHMNRFYRQDDHLELIVNKQEYLMDILSGLEDIIKEGSLSEEFNNMRIRVTYKVGGM